MKDYINATQLIKEHNTISGSKKVLTDFYDIYAYKSIKSKLLHVGIDPKKTKRGRYGKTLLHKDFNTVFEAWLKKDLIYPTIRKEALFFDVIKNCFEGLFEIKFQHKFLKYYCDIYIPELNLIVEYDEKHHNKQKNKINDLKREHEIKKKFNVSVIRHKEKECVSKTINNILKIAVEAHKLNIGN